MRIDLKKMEAHGLKVTQHDEVITITAFHDMGNSDIVTRVRNTIKKVEEHFPQLTDREHDDLMDKLMNDIDNTIILSELTR